MVTEYDELALFMITFPMNYIMDTLLPMINKLLTQKVSLHEYVRWIGLTFSVGCYKGRSNCKQWFLRDPELREEGAPFHLNDWMTGNQYEQILQAHLYTNRDPPEYVDKFFEIRQLQEAWNDHYASKYLPSFFNCLDESMNIWLHEFCTE